jgi:tripartite-type tricarboxylate transporter receptor subunit TctC
MQVALGQPVVVEPKPGGNSTLATAMIPQAPADGCNWVMATISHVVVPHPQSVPSDPLAVFQASRAKADREVTRQP